MFTYGHFCLLMDSGWSFLNMVRLSFTTYYTVNHDDIIQLNKMNKFLIETEG